jgi:hypothetical protein
MKTLPYLLAPVFLAGSIAVAVNHGGWSWPLLLWGIGIGGFQVVALLFLRELAYGISEVPDEVKARTRTEERERFRPSYILIGAIGLATGIESAGLESRQPDLVLTIVILVAGVVFPALRLPRAIERMKQA